MTTLGFVRRYIGLYATAVGGVGRECVDLANLYLAQVWAKHHVYLNAVDWATIHIEGMAWVANGPTNVPPLGSLVVWGPYPKLSIGADGHIALALTGDTMEFVSFDQNWPEHAPCRLNLHTYDGVLGWHQPAG